MRFPKPTGSSRRRCTNGGTHARKHRLTCRMGSCARSRSWFTADRMSLPSSSRAPGCGARLPFTTGYVLELLAGRVDPRALVEKSPSIIFHPGSMQRAARMFPMARFIHLVEHPRRHCEAVVAAIKDVVAHDPNRVPQWLRQLACFSAAHADESSQAHPELDPQQAWFALNKNICEFP